MSSAYTQKTRVLYWFLWVLRIVLLLAPAIIYVILAMYNGEVMVAKKVLLCGLTAVALIITLLNIFMKNHYRSPIWLILIGLYVCIQHFLIPLIIIIAVVSVLDDFVLAPLCKYYKTMLISSKTYDKRKKEEEILEAARKEKE